MVDKMAKLPVEEHGKLKEIKHLYGIPIKTLLVKAIQYALKNKKHVWGIR